MLTASKDSSGSALRCPACPHTSQKRTRTGQRTTGSKRACYRLTAQFRLTDAPSILAEGDGMLTSYSQRNSLI
eukprot:3343170-Pleurochrysis_carterae.AAC.1